MALSYKELQQIEKNWKEGKVKQAEMANKSNQAPAKNRTVPKVESKAQKAQKANDIQSIQTANDLMASQKSVRNQNLPSSVNKLNVSTDMSMPSPVNKLTTSSSKNLGASPKDSLNDIKKNANFTKYYNYDNKEEKKELGYYELKDLREEADNINKKASKASYEDRKRYKEIQKILADNEVVKASKNKSMVDSYLTPGRRLSESEELAAKQIVDDYFKKNEKAKKMLQLSNSNPNAASRVRAQMSKQEQEEYAKMTALMNKTSNLSAFTYGMLNIVPFGNTAMDKMGELMGVDDKYNYSAQEGNVKTQSPWAYTGGDMTSKLAAYSVLGGALEKIPQVASFTNGAGQMMAGGNSIIGNQIGNVIRGTMADIVLDTLPTEIENYKNGMRGPELLENTAGNILGNTMLNAGGEFIPTLLKNIDFANAAKNAPTSIREAANSVPAPKVNELEAERALALRQQNDWDALRAELNRRPTNLEMEQAANVDNMDVLRQAMAEQEAERVAREEAERIAREQAAREVPRVGEEPSLLAKETPNETTNPIDAHKQEQLDVILKTNPALRDDVVWVRDLDDIKTFDEVWAEEPDIDPDFTDEMAQEAMRTGKIKVYSSYDIKNGTFVTPSYMEALAYAGTPDNVKSAVVNLDDVAWIDSTQGQLAKVAKETPIEQVAKEVPQVLNETGIDATKSAPVTTKPSNVKQFHEYVNNKKLQNGIKFDNEADSQAFDEARKGLYRAYQKFINNPTKENVQAIDDYYRQMTNIAKNGYELDNSSRDVYRQMKKDFADRTKGMTIRLSDTDMAEMTDLRFKDINRKLSTLGNNTGMKVRQNSGTPIDSVWDDLVAASGGQLDPNLTNTQDMVRALVDYVDDLQMKVKSPVTERIPADVDNYIPEEFWDDISRIGYEASTNATKPIDNVIETSRPVYTEADIEEIRNYENNRKALIDAMSRGQMSPDEVMQTSRSIWAMDEYMNQKHPDLFQDGNYLGFDDASKTVAEDIGLNPNTRLDDEVDIPNERVTDYGSVKLEEELPQGTGTVNERPEFDNPNPQFGVSDFYNNTLKKIVSEEDLAKYYDEADYLYEKGSHNQMMDNAYNILKKDFEGEYNRLLNTEYFTAQDVATASMIRNVLDKTGHAKEAAEFSHRIRPVMSTATAQALEAQKLFAQSTPEGAVDAMLIQINKAIDNAKGEGYNLTVQRLGDKVADAIKNDDEELLVKILDDNLGSNAVGKNNKVRYKNKEVKGKQEVLDFVENAKAQKKSAAEIAEEAKRMIIKANGGADVPYEAESIMLDLAKKMENLQPSSREYIELEAQMARYAQNFMPTSLGNKIKTVLYTHMLGNLKTALTRNFGGNVVSQTVEKAQKPLRSLLDSAIGKKTGVRNYTMGNIKEQAKAYGKGFKQGASDQWKDIRTGLNTTRSGEEGLLNALDNNTKAWKYNNPVLDPKKWKSDASVTDKGRYAINKVNDIVMGIMGEGDRPIYEANFASAKAELNYILNKYGEDAIQTVGTTGKEASAGDLINFWAHQRALESVFQQGSLTANGLSKIKKAVGDISKDQFGVDILSMPVSAFTQVPGNMISVGMDYSPAGIIKNAANTISELRSGNFNQKRFVDQTSRNITGAGMLGGGVAAYQHGRITGPKSEDTDKNKAESSANELEYALRLPGNIQLDISDIPYVGGTLQGAAEFGEALKSAKRGEISYPEAYAKGIGGAIEAQFGTSAMQGYNRILGAGNTYNTSNTMADNLKNTLGSAMSMFVPSLVRQTAAATDEYKRDLGKYGSFEYYWNNVKNSVPGLRETLPIKTNNQGVPYLQNQGRGLGMKLAENYLLPYTISQPDRVYSDMDKVANSLYDVLGTEANPAYTPGISRTTAKEWLGDNYSEDNYYLLKQNYGAYDSELGNAVINSDIFSQLSPEAQVKALNDVHTAAKELTNRNYGGAKSNTVADLYQNDNKDAAIDSILYGSLFSEYGNDTVKVKYSDYSKDYYNTYGEQGLDALKKVIGSSTKQEQWLANLRDHSKELNLSDAQVESMIRAIKGDDLAQDVRDGKKTASEYYLGKAGNSSSTYNKEATKEETTRTGLNSNVPDSVEEMMRQADTSNRDGYPNAKEVKIYLDSLDLTQEEKAEIYPQMFRRAPKENPYK